MLNTGIRNKKRTYIMLMSPTLLMILLLIIVPLLVVLYMSFTNYSLLTPFKNRFIGFSNYLKMINDERFINSVKVTITYGIATVFFQMLIGLMIALLLSKNFKYIRNSRALFLLPMSIPPIIIAIVWKFLFMPNIPGINYILSIFGINAPSWFASASTAMAAIIIANVWQCVPYVMIILLAAIESLPIYPYESAIIDGANSWQLFRYITIPLLKPSILFVATFRAIESLKVFPLIFVMTGGGPGISTEPLNYYTYATAFKYNKLGYGSALIIAMLIILTVIVYIFFRFNKESIGNG